MPETLPEAARLSELLEIVQEGGRRLPWSLWTSCSFRRIKTGHLMGDRGDGKDVLSGSICHDGVADLSMPEHQLEALVEIMNLLPALASSEMDQLRTKKAERALLRFVSNADEDAQQLPAIQFILNRSDLIAEAMLSALSPEGEP